MLSNDAKNYLKSNHNKNDDIKYKEALNHITIDLNAAGEVNQEGKGKMVWTVQALVKPSCRSPSGGDSISQVAG